MPTPKFPPGHSGNPKGRPKDKTPATIIRKAIAEEMPDIIQSVITAAKLGDLQASKILLDRVCPPLKPQAQPINVSHGEQLSETGANIIAATVNGDIPPDIGSQLIMALSNQAKLIDLEEVADRLRRIEQLLSVRK
jgi:Family of unknown function (DUF5681)